MCATKFLLFDSHEDQCSSSLVLSLNSTDAWKQVYSLPAPVSKASGSHQHHDSKPKVLHKEQCHMVSKAG